MQRVLVKKTITKRNWKLINQFKNKSYVIQSKDIRKV